MVRYCAHFLATKPHKQGNVYMFINWEHPPERAKRYYSYGSDWSGGARWAFFAIFIVLIIIVVFGTMRINRARTRQGRDPIYGTRWMTPPSYFQSQDQYNQPTRGDPDMPNAYVPTYTETANDNDMGYYDQAGNFHENPNAKGPLMPEQAHQRTTSYADGVPLSDYNAGSPGAAVSDHDAFYRRPSGQPPAVSTTGDSDPVYQPPPGPPPGEDYARPLGQPPRS